MTSFKLALFCCRLLLTLLIKVAAINQFTVNNYTPGDTERMMNVYLLRYSYSYKKKKKSEDMNKSNAPLDSHLQAT